MSRSYDLSLHTYTVIGIHDGGRGEQFARRYEDINAGGAADEATAEFPDLVVAAVVKGTCEIIDPVAGLSDYDPDYDYACGEENPDAHEAAMLEWEDEGSIL